MTRFLHHIQKEKKLKPIWACVDEGTQELLAEKFNWRGLSCIAEARFDPVETNPEQDKELRKKIKQAERNGVECCTVQGEVPPEVKEQTEEQLSEWDKEREKRGAQIHTTSVRLWDDAEHRRYFYATNKEKKVR